VERAHAHGASVVELDCRTVEPTERGFLQAVGGFDDVEALTRQLRRLVPPVALALDHCEVFGLMDTWLRQTLVPSLPAGVSLVLVGRERPVAGWLTRLYLNDVEDPLSRRALEAASIVRRVTEPVLGAMLEEPDGGEAPRRLLDLPFVDVGRDGLVVHEAVRDAIAGFLHGTNPTRYRGYRRAAWRELRSEMRPALEYASVVLDFGPGSVDGWPASLVAGELGVADQPVLDEAARELGVQGRVVSLTPLELGLFRHLRAREGSIGSRNELLREVWGTDFNGGSNVVDAVVRTLRHKLGAAGAVVETVRGSGYRLGADRRADLSWP
jgi:hypothetical protein